MKQEALKELLAEMSLQEKIDQMLQLNGSFYLNDRDTVLTGPAAQLGIAADDIYMAGSILGNFGAESLINLQKEYLEKQPHRIPLLFMMDVIHGLRTIFPIPLAQGAAFEPELAGQCAAAAAREAAVSGLHATFAPMADLVRDARWGRVMESTGEDPYLNSQYAEAMVRGFQGDDPAESGRVAACIKHFAGYGAALAGRDYTTAELNERTLREYYLPAYRAGIDAGVCMVMTSFNLINNIPATANRWLMRDILRQEMGFEGVLISDYAAILETITHGYAEDGRDAAVKALQAGVDIDMMSNVYAQNLAALVAEGIIREEQIDEAVWRILEMKNRLGLFENPYKDADASAEIKVILCDEHRQIARTAAAKTFVLLKNEDRILPLKKSRIAFIGPYTDRKEMLSSWAFTGDVDAVVTIKAAAESALAGWEMSFSAGCPIVDSTVKLAGFTQSREEESGREVEEALLQEALLRAREAEVVIMPLGEHFLQSGEAKSRAMIDIPEIQMELFRRVYEVNQNIVILLFCGRPLDLRELSRKAKAVLQVWLPGTEGGNAIIDVLSGAVNPSGKLPVSIPYCVGQVPVSYNSFSTGRPQARNETNSFCSKYLDIPNEPLYPFGYGQSYTSFTCSAPAIDRSEIREDETAAVTVKVKNTGAYAGTEVVQLYIHDLTASVVRPVKELKGYRKVTLAAGAEQEVRFEIGESMLRFYREDGIYGSEPGRFDIYTGPDSSTEDKVELVLL